MLLFCLYLDSSMSDTLTLLDVLLKKLLQIFMQALLADEQ